MKTRDIQKSKLATMLTAWLCLVVGFSFSLHAQSPGDQYWSDEFSVSGAAGYIGTTGVLTTHTATNGIYVGGVFNAMNGVPANGIAYFDGTNWNALGDGLIDGASPGIVRAVYADGNEVYVAGEFTHAGSTEANNIAVWNTNTEEWSAVGTGSTNGTDGAVHAMLKVGSKLYIAGNFSNVNGNAMNNITYWDGSSFNAVGSGTDGEVLDLTVINNEIYATGDFANAGGNPAANMAIWDGANWSEFAGGSDAPVHTIAAVDTSIYVGGKFNNLNGNPINYIGRWDGTVWNALPTEPNADVYDIKDTPDGLLVAGKFDAVGILDASGIARYSNSGWEATSELIQDFLILTSTVYTIDEYNGEYVLGGMFYRSDSYSFNHIAGLNSSMELSPFKAKLSGNGVAGVIVASATSGSDMYVGGLFTGTNNVAANNIAKWDGAAWSALGEGVDGSVSAILVDGNKIYVGGDFSQAGSVQANNIAVWDTQTETWSALGSGANNGTDNEVIDILKVSSKIYVAGSFTQAGGSSANRVAVWNGSSWANLGSGTNNDVSSLALMGGTIVAGGQFTMAGGNTANNIAKWDGSAWSALATGTDGTVRDLVVVGDSVLYAGGDFSNADGSPAKKVAKWDGTAWEALGAGLDNTVHTLHFADNTLYAGGAFQNSGVTEISGVASWNGTSWEALGSGLTGTGTQIIGTLSVTQDNQLVVGGNFSEVGHKPASAISMYDLDEPTVSNETETEVASDFTLEQNYPNPFNPSTNITYKVPSQSPVTLKVYNMLGQEVATLVNSVKTAGSHTVSFDASQLSSGMYIYRLTSASTSITKKMMLLK